MLLKPCYTIANKSLTRPEDQIASMCTNIGPKASVKCSMWLETNINVLDQLQQ